MAGGRLEGKVAVVTGAARGTGLVIARRFAEDGGRATYRHLDATVNNANSLSVGDAIDVAAAANAPRRSHLPR